MRYFKILDNTILDDNVPSTLPDSEKNIGTKEEPNMVQMTFGEYFVKSGNGGVATYDVKDGDGNVIFSILIFSRLGKEVVAPNFSNPKLLEITEKEYKGYVNNHFRIQVYSKFNELKDPLEIDYINCKHLTKTLQLRRVLVKGTVAEKIFFLNRNGYNDFEDEVVKEEYNYDFASSDNSVKFKVHYHFYKMNGEVEILSSTDWMIVNEKTYETEKWKEKRARIVDELKAELKGTALETDVLNYYESIKDLIESYIDIGSRGFYDEVSTNTTESWLNLNYVTDVTYRMAIMNYINIHEYDV